MGQENDPWNNLRKKAPVEEPVTVSDDPWDYVTESSPKRTEDPPKRAPDSPWRKTDPPKKVDADSPWAGAPRSLWGKPKASLPKLLPYALIRLGTLTLIGANLLIGFLFLSTYWVQNVILLTYLGASTAVLIHYFLLMKYRDS